MEAVQSDPLLFTYIVQGTHGMVADGMVATAVEALLVPLARVAKQTSPLSKSVGKVKENASKKNLHMASFFLRKISPFITS